MAKRKTKRIKYLEELNNKNGFKLISTWDELAECKSETHYLEIEDCCGWILPTIDNGECHIYLSTHTFYGGMHEYSTKILQKCGFNVIIDNWDKED